MNGPQHTGWLTMRACSIFFLFIDSEFINILFSKFFYIQIISPQFQIPTYILYDLF